MTVEVFLGTPEALAARLVIIIAGPNVINFVIPSHQKGVYIILYT